MAARLPTNPSVVLSNEVSAVAVGMAPGINIFQLTNLVQLDGVSIISQSDVTIISTQNTKNKMEGHLHENCTNFTHTCTERKKLRENAQQRKMLRRKRVDEKKKKEMENES